jgi:hypothetical protein
MKTITKVFILIAALVLALVGWSLTFGKGGLVQSMYNGVAVPINQIFQKITGSNKNLVPEMDKDVDGKKDAAHARKLKADDPKADDSETGFNN